MCEMMLCSDIDSEQNPKPLSQKHLFSFSKEHVAHLRAQYSDSYTMQNLVYLLSPSPEGLS